MARKVSKRKRPLKEDFQIKELLKVESEVFDKTSLIDLSKLMKKGIIQTVDYPVSTGKEANVFRATAADGSFIAVKIYKIETTHFFRRREYLEGDPRFRRIKHSEKEIVKAFARKEFKNLEICERAKVHAPKPYFLKNNILVMEFLGEGELPYPTMEMLGPKEPEKALKSILSDIRKMQFEKSVIFRKNDYFPDLAKDFNKTVDVLEKTKSEAYKTLHEALISLQDLKIRMKDDEEALKKIQDLIEKLENIIKLYGS